MVYMAFILTNYVRLVIKVVLAVVKTILTLTTRVCCELSILIVRRISIMNHFLRLIVQGCAIVSRSLN